MENLLWWPIDAQEEDRIATRLSQIEPLVGLCAVAVTGTAVVSTGSERVQPSRPRTVAKLKNISTGRGTAVTVASNGDPTVSTKNSNNMRTIMNTSFTFQAQRVFEAAGKVRSKPVPLRPGTPALR
ncbi:hypothetical protein C8J57DRAFT_1256856 [Mycena rebaudengoi]|nr:hypothetical protein C8J57DRAFT_1256856 [Mycena rebaudengoi]